MAEIQLTRFDLIVVGASAGGVEALSRLFAKLPSEPRLPIACVIHLPQESKFLPGAFNAPAPYTIAEAEDKLPLMPGEVRFAPPGYHLLIERGGTYALALDEPVHFARPSIDVLFESASRAYGPRLLAILLTGANADGTEGLIEVRRFGGTAVAQDPSSAYCPVMPESAIKAGAVDLVVDLREGRLFEGGPA